MMLIGMIWAALAPLLLLAAVAVVGTRMRRYGLVRPRLVAAAIVLLPVAAIWLYDHAEFARICAVDARAEIRLKAKSDGILLTSQTANSFGTRYLYEEGFAWFEAVDIYDRKKWVRYERDADGRIVTRPIAEPQARHEVRETFTQPASHTGLTVTSIVERGTGVELARAGNANFDGGHAKWVLGAWGVSSCPSAFSDSQGFRGFYHLARDTLRTP